MPPATRRDLLKIREQLCELIDFIWIKSHIVPTEYATKILYIIDDAMAKIEHELGMHTTKCPGHQK